jgi:hypothetical protein
MGVAALLGVEHLGTPLMEAACRAWPRWCDADPELAVVDELAELPEWMRHAARHEGNDVLARLAALTASDTNAVAVLAWLLIPGATRIATDLSDLHRDIDGLVAGQFWIEAARAHELGRRGVAATILRATRRGVLTDLGVGDGARRGDRAWAQVVQVESLDERIPAEEVRPWSYVELLELLRDALKDRAIIAFDVWLLWELASVADERGAPTRRGRMGLTTPGVTATVALGSGRSAETLRKRAMKAVTRLQEYVAARGDEGQFAEWKARHPMQLLTAREELELAIGDFELEYRLTGRVPGWVELADEAGPERPSESA